MLIFECRCRSYCQCRDAEAEISKWPFINLSVTTYFVELLNGCFQTFKDKIFFACMSFFTIFTVVKILAKFGTTRKILMLVYYEVVGVVFWVFKGCLRIFVMFVDVDMCKTVLIAGESTYCGVLSSNFYWVIKVILRSANYYF